MARKITFEKLVQIIDGPSSNWEILGEYIEFDPESAIPRLRIKPDALVDEAPDDFDVDALMARRTEEDEEEEDESRLALAAGLVERTRVAAEGDSWFRLPLIVRPKAIVQRLRRDYGATLRVKNKAKWGDTLAGIFQEKQYMELISDFDPEWFLLSAGGNDIVDALQRGELLFDYDPQRPVDDYLTSDGHELIAWIGRTYALLLEEVMSEFEHLKVICYAYDYPRPLVGNGNYIGRYMRRHGIPNELMGPIIEDVIKRHGGVVKTALPTTTVSSTSTPST